jgi:hypothetical protein
MPSYPNFPPAQYPVVRSSIPAQFIRRINMAERKRVRRNTLERRCLGKAFKRLFVTSPKGVFKMLEKIKRV